MDPTYEIIPPEVLVNASRIMTRHKRKMNHEVRAAFLAAGHDPDTFGLAVQVQIALGDVASERPDASLIGPN